MKHNTEIIGWFVLFVAKLVDYFASAHLPIVATIALDVFLWIGLAVLCGLTIYRWWRQRSTI